MYDFTVYMIGPTASSLTHTSHCFKNGYVLGYLLVLGLYDILLSSFCLFANIVRGTLTTISAFGPNDDRYINSTGTSSAEGQNVGFETEAFAIVDTMNYVKPPIHTICIGQALGMGAMLLGAGEKGHRAALPNATIMLHQPRGSAQGQVR